MLSILHQPYPCADRSAHWWRTVLGVSGFVAAFLFVFSPFGLDEAPVKERLLLCLGYGLVCAVILTFNQFVLPVLFPMLFRKATWTVGKQILWSGFNFLTIAVGNLLLTVFIVQAQLNLLNLSVFLGITVAVGIIPVSVFVLLDYLRLTRQHLAEAQRLTALIQHPAASVPDAEAAPPTPAASVSPLVILTEENGREALRLPATDLLALLTADNYVEVFCLRNGKSEKVLLRSSLKRLEEEALANFPDFFRCHRTCLVNLSRVEEVLGNSQGCRLHLTGLATELPVSRNKVAELEARLRGVQN